MTSPKPPKVNGSHIAFDNMTWPNPEDPAGIQQALRYGQPTKEQLFIAAAYISAYQHLFESPQKPRNAVISRIRQILADQAKEQQ